MADYKQVSRHLRLDTPLGEDRLLVTRFSGREEISRLFTYRLDLLSEDDAIAPADIVGKNVTITLGLLDGTERHFNGYVSAFACCGTGDRLSRYTAEVVPWLWFLTRTADCRIFQDKSMPSVIEQVFQDLEFTDYEIADVRGDHAPRHFCVQYRETDFNFVSRLMEDAGIFYYFRHEKDRHVLVLADQNATHADCPEKDVSVAAPERGGDPTDSLENWTHRYEFRPGKWTHTDFNFETPSALLQASTGTLVDIPGASRYEIYDYPGGYTTRNEGEAAVKIRMEEEEAAFDTVTASGSCRTFFAGGKFTVAWHHSGAEEGKAYVITSLRHEASLGGAYLTGGEAAALEYRNEFACIPAAVTFRPARSTPRPAVRGVQTAIVVGPAGEEIYTDKYGRVKVQFHWDREGKRDENSSCWIRVAQLWAGRKWGAMYVPRIGQEVVVEFLEGDPDRPIITGRVYNAEGMPPYELPAHMTMSTIKSNSSPDGSGFNEIRFEDKKGEEQIFVHGEKNLDVRIKNDAFEWIGNDRHLVVKKDQLEHVEHNRNEVVDADHKEKIGKDRHLQVAGKEAKAVGGSLSLTVKGDVIEVFKADHSEQTTGDYYLKADNVVIEAMTNVTLKVGGSSIAIEAGGIGIKTSGQIKIESGATTDVKATGPLSVQSSATTIKGDAVVTVQGGAVKIN